MVKILIGENYGIKLDEIKKEHDNIDIVDLSDISEYERLIDELVNTTLFEDSENKIIFLKNFDSLRKEKRKILIEYLKILRESATPIVFVDVVKPLSEMKEFDFEDLTLPKPWKKKEWLKLMRNMFLERKREIDDEALELMFSMIGPDMDLLKMEMEKLLLFTDERIKVKDVEEVVHRHSLSKLDTLLFSVSEGKPNEVSKMEEIFINTPIQLVIHSLTDHFISLLKLLVSVERKERYGWVEISKISNKLSIPTPKVAGFLGFPLGNIRRMNHLNFYNLNMLNAILMKIMKIQKEFKTLEYESKIFITRLVEIAEYIRESMIK